MHYNIHISFSKDEVFTEALKVLYGTNHGNQASETSGTSEKSGNVEKQQQQSSVADDGNGELILPQFCDMAQYLAERATVRMLSASTRHVVGNHTLPFSPATFVEVQYFGVRIWKLNKNITILSVISLSPFKYLCTLNLFIIVILLHLLQFHIINTYILYS
jgi:hypothetical protein